MRAAVLHLEEATRSLEELRGGKQSEGEAPALASADQQKPVPVQATQPAAQPAGQPSGKPSESGLSAKEKCTMFPSKEAVEQASQRQEAAQKAVWEKARVRQKQAEKKHMDFSVLFSLPHSLSGGPSPATSLSHLVPHLPSGLAERRRMCFSRI